MSLLTGVATRTQPAAGAAQVTEPARRDRWHFPASNAAPALYLAVAVLVWWQVWSGHPTSAMTCGCGDPSLFVSSFAWVGHAVAHGNNPFLSTAMYHPAGINLLANTSGLLEAFLLLPVTWLFGPVASLNVADTLAPAASALATYWAVRRSLRVGRFGALVAGLVVELSPAVIGNVAVSHLQVGLLAFVPVVGVCLHELLVVQNGRPWRWGLLLAAAAVGQFFAGTELLVILALLSAMVVVTAAAAYALLAVRDRPAAVVRARHAGGGLGVGALAAGTALAAPAWFALAGPRHFTGSPWPGLMSLSGARLGAVVSAPPGGGNALVQASGYLGAVGAPQNYLGVGAVVLAILAVVFLWRRPVVWALSAVGFVSGWLALGAIWQPFPTARPSWVPFLPWSALQHLPVLSNILAENFAVVTVVVVAALLGLLVDRVWHLGRGLARGGAVASFALSVAALLPLASTWSLPLAARSVDVPAWFVRDAPRLPSGSVVLAYPFVGPPGGGEAAVWQARVGLHFSLAGGYGLVPGAAGTPDRGETPGSSTAILGALSWPGYGRLPALTDRKAMAAVRASLAAWHVTAVVVTDRGRDPGYAARWFTALLGQAPAEQDGAQVWLIPAHRVG